jgi:hypothetical protein
MCSRAWAAILKLEQAAAAARLVGWLVLQDFLACIMQSLPARSDRGQVQDAREKKLQERGILQSVSILKLNSISNFMRVTLSLNEAKLDHVCH